MACGCHRRRRHHDVHDCGCKKRRKKEVVAAVEEFIPIGRITLDCAPVLFKTKGQARNILCCPQETVIGPVCCPPALIPFC